MSNTNDTALAFSNNEAQHRYEATLDGKLAGYAEYNLLTDAIMFTHTEVLPEFEGKNPGLEQFASILAERLTGDLASGQVRAVTVKLWESDTAFATCRRAVR